MTSLFKPFYPEQSNQSKRKYHDLLSAFSQLSFIYTDSDKAYIDYRVAENIFCRTFNAENKSRQDLAVDAVKIRDGIGIKTFIRSSSTSKMEKIAEFVNRQRYPLDEMNIDRLINQVSRYRNQRLKDTAERFNLNNTLYHYLVRDIGKIYICESPMILIDVNSLYNSGSRGNIIRFKDKYLEYYFHLSKHTLFKRFKYNDPFHTLNISSQRDHDLISWALQELDGSVSQESELPERYDYVLLPLYSTRTGQVQEKSGLNQWNAEGRPRDPNEVYIPIPKAVHIKKPGFFPPRNQKFILRTSDGHEFSAKVCQDNNKALMSDPNKELGEWLLREQLNVPERHIVTYNDLQEKDVDSVIIYRISENEYEIRLHNFGGYEQEYHNS